MEIVKCRWCGTRVVLNQDGVCPSCRRKQADIPVAATPECRRESSSRPNGPPPVSPAQHGWSSHRSPEPAIEKILEMLRQDQLPHCCSVCGADAEGVHDIRVWNDDFALSLPVRICRRCAPEVPFREGEARLCEGALSLSILMTVALVTMQQWLLAVGCLAVAVAAILRMKLAGKSRTTPLGEGFFRIAAYRDLLKTAPGATLAQLPGTFRTAAEPLALAKRCEESVLFLRLMALLGPKSELERSLMPWPIGHAVVEMVDREIMSFFHAYGPRFGYFLQVVCAVLPGKRNAFEIQGLPPGIAERLLSHLSALPSWPVASPFLFVVQRRLRGESPGQEVPVEPPLITWKRIVAPHEEASFADVACRFHGIERAKEPVKMAASDIEALRARAPHDTNLAVWHAKILTEHGQLTEGLAICDSLIAGDPGELNFRYERVACLESGGQLERAAAECQSVLAEFPSDVMTCGFLAHLQLELGRAEDAIRTVSEAICREEQPHLYLVRARARGTIGQFDLAMEDLNVALSKDADFADAYLLRSRLHLGVRNFDQALADIAHYDRTAGSTVESVSIKAAALSGKGVPGEAAQAISEALQSGLDHPFLKLRRAECLAESGKLELALEDCNSLIGQYPEAAEVYAIRAAVHAECGRISEAVTDAERSLELGPEGPQALRVLGWAAAEAGDLERGEEFLTRSVQLDPKHSSTLFQRARIRVKLGNDEAAIDDLTAAIQCSPDQPDSLVLRGYLHLKAERSEAAMADFESAIRVAPGMSEAYRGRAGVHELKGNKMTALADLDKAAMLAPDNVACRLARANLLLQEGDREGAKVDLDAAIQLSPDLVPALYQRGTLNLSLGELGAARRDFETILDHMPEAAFAFIGRSVAWEQAGDFEQSELDRREATRAAPQDAEALEASRLEMNAFAACHREQFDKAVDYASQAIQQNPDSAWAYRIRAWAYWYSERFVEALDDYSHLIASADEANHKYDSSRGQIHAELGEFDKALEDLDRAIAVVRENGPSAELAYALNGRGRALTGLGRYEEAERDFGESLRLRPDNAWLHFNRGLLYLESGQPKKAATCFDLSLSVSHPPLPPRKRSRAQGFLAKLAQSGHEDSRQSRSLHPD